MPHTRYIIVRHEDEWLIKFGDGEYDPYRNQAEAMRIAIDAAQKLGEQGESTQVCMMGEQAISDRNGPTARILIHRAIWRAWPPRAAIGGEICP
jgi:hypothetical protein